MKTRSARALLLVAVFAGVLGLLPGIAAAAEIVADPEPVGAIAQEQGGEGDAAGSGQRVEVVAIWTIVGSLIGALVLGVLYLFKRRIGGFPAHPTWVAPISIMESKTFPDETTFGDVSAHDAHAPAHH